MKLLLDTCVWGGACQVLMAGGHDVVWTGEWEMDPGDVEILAFAWNESRVLVTLDKDFGELAIHRGLRHCGILRLTGFPARLQGVACLQALETHGELLSEGCILTLAPERLRIRRP